jgi:hypothetical protein
MITQRLTFAASAAALILSVLPAAAQDTNPAVVIEWNQLAQATVPASTGPLAVRQFAVLHAAMFDAANSIERRYTPFHVRVQASSGASPEAAVAQAAHDVLVALVPGAGPRAQYDAALAATLSRLPPGRASQGAAVGRAAASHVLAWRASDGIFGPAVPYSLPAIAGLWQPAAPGVPPGLTQLPTATPFTLQTITQFMVPRHPELNSARYATDFEEVKAIGAAGSVTRTPTQTQTALLFAGSITSTSIFMMWNNVTREVTLSRHLSLLDSARLFAFVNASMIDSLLSTQTAKFSYGLWRPITAIRNAAIDENPATTAEIGWTPLLGTPPYPSYPGNMAGIGACAALALQHGLGTGEVAFAVTWIGSGGNPNVTRQYASFSQLAQEEADSRIYGGIHYRFDNEASQASCTSIVQHAYASVMRPN